MNSYRHTGYVDRWGYPIPHGVRFGAETSAQPKPVVLADADGQESSVGTEILPLDAKTKPSNNVPPAPPGLPEEFDFCVQENGMILRARDIGHKLHGTVVQGSCFFDEELGIRMCTFDMAGDVSATVPACIEEATVVPGKEIPEARYVPPDPPQGCCFDAESSTLVAPAGSTCRYHGLVVTMVAEAEVGGVKFASVEHPDIAGGGIRVPICKPLGKKARFVPRPPAEHVPEDCCIDEETMAVVCPDPSHPSHGKSVKDILVECFDAAEGRMCRIKVGDHLVDLPVCHAPPAIPIPPTAIPKFPVICCYDPMTSSLICEGTPYHGMKVELVARAELPDGTPIASVEHPSLPGGGVRVPICLVLPPGELPPDEPGIIIPPPPGKPRRKPPAHCCYHYESGTLDCEGSRLHGHKVVLIEQGAIGPDNVLRVKVHHPKMGEMELRVCDIQVKGCGTGCREGWENQPCGKEGCGTDIRHYCGEDEDHAPDEGRSHAAPDHNFDADLVDEIGARRRQDHGIFTGEVILTGFRHGRGERNRGRQFGYMRPRFQRPRVSSDLTKVVPQWLGAEGRQYAGGYQNVQDRGYGIGYRGPSDTPGMRGAGQEHGRVWGTDHAIQDAEARGYGVGYRGESDRPGMRGAGQEGHRNYGTDHAIQEAEARGYGVGYRGESDRPGMRGAGQEGSRNYGDLDQKVYTWTDKAGPFGPRRAPARRFAGWSGRPDQVEGDHGNWKQDGPGASLRDGWKPHMDTLQQGAINSVPWGHLGLVAPPSISGDSAGYNTRLWRDRESVRQALAALGYPGPNVGQFQGDWNFIVQVVATHPALQELDFARVMHGNLILDETAGPETMNAMEVALVNQDAGLDWSSLRSIVHASGFGASRHARRYGASFVAGNACEGASECPGDELCIGGVCVTPKTATPTVATRKRRRRRRGRRIGANTPAQICPACKKGFSYQDKQGACQCSEGAATGDSFFDVWTDYPSGKPTRKRRRRRRGRGRRTAGPVPELPPAKPINIPFPPTPPTPKGAPSGTGAVRRRRRRARAPVTTGDPSTIRHWHSGAASRRGRRLGVR